MLVARCHNRAAPCACRWTRSPRSAPTQRCCWATWRHTWGRRPARRQVGLGSATMPAASPARLPMLLAVHNPLPRAGAAQRLLARAQGPVPARARGRAQGHRGHRAVLQVAATPHRAAHRAALLASPLPLRSCMARQRLRRAGATCVLIRPGRHPVLPRVTAPRMPAPGSCPPWGPCAATPCTRSGPRRWSAWDTAWGS